jgi:hypothetical protein
MPEESSNTIRRVVYKEITASDRRKFVARSNDAATGGGARDLRFSPYKRFGDVFSRLFPTKRTEQRRRDGVQKDVPILVGEFHWHDAENRARTMESTFEPPTDVRPSEGRLTKVHTYPCFANVPSDAEGIVLLLLIQNAQGAVWPHFTTERSLRGGGWNRDVADGLLACIDAKRAHVSVAGYMDFETGQSFCNAG